MKHILAILLIFTAYVQCELIKSDGINIAQVGLEQGVEQTSLAFYTDRTVAAWIRAEKDVIDRLSVDPRYIVMGVEEIIPEVINETP